MTPLTVADLLGAWDARASLDPIDRGLVLLGLEEAEVGHDLSTIPLGERVRRLLRLRQDVFGDRLDLTVECPSCQTILEVATPIPELLSSGIRSIPSLVTDGAWTIRYRMPTSADLQAIAGASSVDEARAALIDLCVLEASRDGESVIPRELPDSVVERIGESIDAADPLTDPRLSLVCETCGYAWTSFLDVGAAVWSEIDRWASRMLRDVDALARAYGWSESDILALSPHRRRRYLEMIGDA